MRTFIGIDFSIDLKNKIGDIQRELKKHSKSGRWKYVDNFHLTLKFLNEVDIVQVKEISKRLESICNNSRRFSLKISELGYFPGRDNIRVLWLGLNGDMNSLGKIYEDIEDNLQPLGFPKEKRKYSPHVTIAQDIVFEKEFHEIKSLVKLEEFPEVDVDRIFLFKSEQIGNKRVYTPINEFRFLG